MLALAVFLMIPAILGALFPQIDMYRVGRIVGIGIGVLLLVLLFGRVGTDEEDGS